jgi:hypothetical protein
MSLKDTLAGIGSLLLFAAIGAAGFALLSVFYYGAAWASAQVLPFLSALARTSFALVLFVLIPLAIPRATRTFAAFGMLIASYVFGLTTWMTGLLLTLTLWGFLGVVIGLLLGGVGVVPLAGLATLFNGMWEEFFSVVILVMVTFGTRMGAIYLGGTLER